MPLPNIDSIPDRNGDDKAILIDHPIKAKQIGRIGKAINLIMAIDIGRRVCTSVEKNKAGNIFPYRNRFRRSRKSGLAFPNIAHSNCTACRIYFRLLNMKRNMVWAYGSALKEV